MKIHKICLTGGPSSGKTTSLARITDRLQSLGYRVLIVPEAATLFILGGVQLSKLDKSELLQAQSAMAKTILQMEDSFVEIAQYSNQDTVILFDRGIMDGKAFMGEELFQAVLDQNGWTTVSLRDQRYDAVIHLTTAAFGEGYTLDNNTARTETPEQAREVDTRLKNVWVGHPHLRIIENTSDFEDKVRNVVSAVCNVVGEPEPLEIEKKFLVKNFDMLGCVAQNIYIEQDYLLGSDENKTERIRKRGQNGSFIYFHSIKTNLGPGKNIEVEKKISAAEFLALRERKDPSRQTIKKYRYCFLHQNKYFELDIFVSPDGLTILEVELENELEKVNIPDFIEIDREVTDEKKYTNYQLAKR